MKYSLLYCILIGTLQHLAKTVWPQPVRENDTSQLTEGRMGFGDKTELQDGWKEPFEIDGDPWMEDLTTSRGKTATFNCIVNAKGSKVDDAKAKFLFKRQDANGEIILRDNTELRTYLYGDHNPERISFAMVILQTTRLDQGRYRCEVSLGGVVRYSPVTTLSLFGEPTFILHPVTMNITSLTPFNLSCRAKGPSAVNEIHWMKNEKATEKQTVVNETIPNVFRERRGINASANYSCLAFNMQGEKQSETAVVNVIEIPDVPLEFEFSNVTNVSVLLKWKLGSEGYSVNRIWNITYRLVNLKYTVEDHLVNFKWRSILFTNAYANQYRVKQLQPYASYSFKMRSQNEAGNSNWTEIVSLDMEEGVPSQPPVGVNITVVNNTWVRVTWRRININTANGVLKGYKVMLREVKTENVEIVETNDTTVVLKINWDVKYHLKVAGYTNAGTGIWSNCYVLYKLKFHLLEVDDKEPVKPNVESAVDGTVANETVENETVANETVENHQRNSKNVLYVIIVSIVVIIGFICLTVLGIIWYRRKKNENAMPSKRNQIIDIHIGKTYTKTGTRPVSGDMTMAVEHLELTNSVKEKLKSVLINHNRVEVGRKLGEGEFGCVMQGLLKSINNNTKREVAIKTIKNISSGNELEQFINEGIVMKDFEHPHVLRLIGVCLERCCTKFMVKPLVILPYMQHGDLHTFLLNVRNREIRCHLPLQRLIHFCVQVADGMNYLSEQNFVHRDLAARNCMLDENFQVHVADFGLSRKIYSENYYRQGSTAKVPVKWLALESLVDRIYTTYSDTWSFGVTMWEISTMGQQPYPGIANHEVYDFLQRGMRLRQPLNCPDELYSIMCNCWSNNPIRRPRFKTIISKLNAILERMGPPPPPPTEWVYENVPASRVAASTSSASAWSAGAVSAVNPHDASVDVNEEVFQTFNQTSRLRASHSTLSITSNYSGMIASMSMNKLARSSTSYSAMDVVRSGSLCSRETRVGDEVFRSSSQTALANAMYINSSTRLPSESTV